MNNSLVFPHVNRSSINFHHVLLRSTDFNISLFLQQKRIGKKKKTTVKSCNLNPYWNESFVFVIDEMDMKRVYLDITVSSSMYFISEQKILFLTQGGYATSDCSHCV